jgi:TP901 family phage tail tape measure protein
MAGRFSVEAVFKAIDRVTAPVSKMQNKVRKFTRGMNRGFTRLNRTVNKFSSGIKKGALVAGTALTAFGLILSNIIGIGADFGRAIGSAAAKFPDKIKRGTKEFKALEDAARRVGKTTEFTSVQAAQGLDFLAKAGFNAEFSMRALPDIVDFATAAQIDFAEAADIASDALGAFNLDSDNSIEKMKGLKRIMDVMSLTANSTNTSVSELFEAVKEGAPIAEAAGASIETFSATMGFLANSGIKAGKAGTSAKNIILALAGVGNKAAKTFKSLGISLSDSNGDLRDQFDVLDDLRIKLKEFGSQKQIAIIQSIFGKIPIAAATKLLSEAGKGVRDLREDLEKAGGSSKRTAQFIRNDVKGSIDGLKSAIEGVKISIFSLNEGPLKKAIDRMTEWVRTNEKLIATNIGEFLLDIINNLGNIVVWAKRIGKALLVFFAFSAALKVATAAQILFNIAAAANPIGLIVLAVIALIAGFVALVIWIDDVSAAFDNMSIVAKVLLGPLFILVKAIKFIKDNFQIISRVAGSVSDFIGFTGNNEKSNNEKSNIITPQDRIARSIEENNTTNTSEVTIRTDKNSTAEVTKGKLGKGLSLQSSGAF